MIDYLLDSSDEIVFIDQNKTKKDIVDTTLTIAKALQNLQINQIEVFLEESYEFTCIFLASLLCKIPLTLLDNSLNTCGYFHIDKQMYEKLTKENQKAKAKQLDKNTKIYVRTSGSSGKSKSIEKNLNQLTKEGEFLVDFFKFNKLNTFFSSASHQHFYGLTFKIIVPLISNSKIFSKQIKYPENLLIQNFQNAVLISSPALLKRLNEYKNIKALLSVEKIITAGSKLPLHVRNSLEAKIGEKIIEIYGSTETGAVAYNKNDTFFLLGDNQIQINNKGGIDISSSWCERFTNQDEIEFLENGGFRLLGRIDRIIKLEDKRVSLINIEDFLLTCKLVKDCFIDKHPTHNRLLALIVLSDEGIERFKTSGKTGVVKEITKHLKQRYNSVFLVRYFKILESLPTNSQGKILKSSFKEALQPKTKLIWKEIYKDATKAKFKTKTSLDLFYFTDHFPSFPLLPGFVQLGFVYELANSMGLNIDFENVVENVKFQNFSHPNSTIEVELEVKNQKLYFNILTNDKPCAKGRICLV
ncbi:MAG: acyl-CoA synthetase [Arcobacter sp.]|nr:acyl-CoA synthetase [Arcobacter sp.]